MCTKKDNEELIEVLVKAAGAAQIPPMPFMDMTNFLVK